MIEVELPDGTVVEFPDGTPENVMKNALVKHTRGSSISMGEDIAKSAASGLRSGVETGLGMFGDAATMQGDLSAWIADKFGASPETQEIARKAGSFLHPGRIFPSTDTVQKLTTPVAEATGVQDFTTHRPQSIPGKYMKTVAELAPAAAAGPGSLMRKAAMAVVPGVLSETAGQLTEGTAAEPYARAGGLLAGGVAAAGRSPSAAKLASKGAPTAQELKAQSDELYKTLRDAGIRYDADSFGNTVIKMANDLKTRGFRPIGKVKEAYEWVDDIAKEVGKSPSFDDINSLRMAIGDEARAAYRSPDSKRLGKALDILKDHLDDFEGGAPMVSDKPLPANEFNRLRKAARDTALKNIKQRALDDIALNAETYQSGVEAGIRNGLGNLLRSGRGKQLFKGEERKALLGVAHGGKGLRTLSRYGLDLRVPSGNATFLPSIGALGAGTLVNPAAGAGLLAAGTIAKELSPRLTRRAFERAGAAIRSGKANSKQVATERKALRQQALIRQILTGAAGSRQIEQ